jgi:hypothetical protein
MASGRNGDTEAFLESAVDVLQSLFPLDPEPTDPDGSDAPTGLEAADGDSEHSGPQVSATAPEDAASSNSR